MNILLFAVVDLVAISILTACLYLPRHRRRDLFVSYFGINIGVFAVAAALSSSTVGIGLGMGLFGVLSIIRLRSNELEQHEIAYYFSALAIGLISGMTPSPLWVAMALIALILVVMLVVDNSKVLRRYRHQEVVLDRTFATEEQLESYLSQVLGGARIHQYTVQLLDLVNDKTVLRVRFSAATPPVTGAEPIETNSAATSAQFSAPSPQALVQETR
ncbi:DUF4956 domain-containing protein [Glutamicibacter uratoxydans]|uniref:DUF4956 domain-containing protein n=1 Tax=Glutamicibacter uratoxydans TaxID=43667 RepID=A0A4Y4DQJ1_GLUUR|nr:DUF4956 domain-containing protein [Glutamicibacter uratoxydans]GED05648.1 DUF4956 domain-containing protein [Glutamicibacter uratoxydans]